MSSPIFCQSEAKGPKIRHIRTRAEWFGLNPDKLIVSEKKVLERGGRPGSVYTISKDYAEKIK